MRFKRRTNDYFLSLKDNLTQLDIFLLHSVCSNQCLLVNLWGKKKTLTSCSVHHRSSDPCRVCIHLLGLTALEGSGIKGQWPQGSWGAALACQSDVSRVMAPGRDEPCVLSLTHAFFLTCIFVGAGGWVCMTSDELFYNQLPLMYFCCY